MSSVTATCDQVTSGDQVASPEDDEEEDGTLTNDSSPNAKTPTTDGASDKKVKDLI